MTCPGQINSGAKTGFVDRMCENKMKKEKMEPQRSKLVAGQVLRPDVSPAPWMSQSVYLELHNGVATMERHLKVGMHKMPLECRLGLK